MLPRKRKRNVFIWYNAGRVLIVNTLMGIILDAKLRGNPSWDVAYLLTVSCIAVVNCFVIYYTYEGRFIKVNIAACIAELMASCLMVVAMIAVNFIEGRGSAVLYVAEFQLLDLLIIPIGGGYFCWFAAV